MYKKYKTPSRQDELRRIVRLRAGLSAVERVGQLQTPRPAPPAIRDHRTTAFGDDRDQLWNRPGCNPVNGTIHSDRDAVITYMPYMINYPLHQPISTHPDLRDVTYAPRLDSPWTRMIIGYPERLPESLARTHEATLSDGSLDSSPRNIFSNSPDGSSSTSSSCH